MSCQDKETYLFKLEPEDVGLLFILFAEGEIAAVTLEDFKGDMDPSVPPEVFNLKK